MKRVFNHILKQLHILKAVAFVTFKEWAAYRSHMLVSLFTGPVQFMVQVFIWQAVYAGQTIINGLSLEQMITYYAVVAIIHYLVMDFADWNLHMLIHTGLFVTYVIRPLSHRFFAFSQKVGHRALGLLWEFLPVYCLFLFAFQVKLVPAHLGWALCSIFLGFLMNYFINYCIGITGFWLIRGEGVRRMIQIFSMLFRGVFIPLVFFPDIIQKILFFLPFQFATYVPIRVFIGSYELGGYSFSLPQIIGIQAAAVIIMFLATELLWRLGVKRFTGVGI
jgi:ABC-2 type transport system permease protein